MNTIEYIWLAGALIAWRPLTGYIAYWLQHSDRKHQPNKWAWVIGTIMGAGFACVWFPMALLWGFRHLQFLAIGPERQDIIAKREQKHRDQQAKHAQLISDYESEASLGSR